MEELFADMPEIRFAYLFGSAAEGTETPLSDVDVAVYLEKEANTFEKHLQIHHTLAKRLKKDVDLVVLNNVRNFNLLDAILRHGIVVVDRDPDLRFSFEVEAQHRILGYRAFKRAVHGQD
ncbi:MAG: nucleotidyltransferase domain-containing protein [Caldilineae bacterium]|nr:MAG: nucleotidyltransferase domain-containing protein [Caldilineae bacterium]